MDDIYAFFAKAIIIVLTIPIVFFIIEIINHFFP